LGVGWMAALFRVNNYVLYTRPFELNIVGVRAPETKPNSFDDEIHVLYRDDKNKWVYHVFKATTDPGTYWLRNPMYEQGTAILAEGQYVNAYQIGLHRQKYEALVQRGMLTIIRDYDRDAVLDFNNGNTFTGSGFGINIHRANAAGQTKTVDRNSAGCQVFANASDFEFFMQLCRHHRSLYGNQFTYTLVDLRALLRAGRRTVLAGVAGVSALLSGAALALMNDIKT